jgi:hypothetical protein
MAQLRCRDDVSDDDMRESGVPGGALNLISTSYAEYGHCRDLPLQEKIPKAETGFETGTSCLVARSSDHKATRLVLLKLNLLAPEFGI